MYLGREIPINCPKERLTTNMFDMRETMQYPYLFLNGGIWQGDSFSSLLLIAIMDKIKNEEMK